MFHHARGWFLARLLATLVSLFPSRAADFDYSDGFVGARFSPVRYPPALQVIHIVPLGPAAKAGVQINDMVVAVDGVSVRDLSPTQKHEAFSGAPSGVVKLSV